MDLNNIDLPASVITSLYHSSLVDLPGTITGPEPAPVVIEKTPETNEVSEVKWLGENRKNILIIVNHTGSTYLPDKELEFLTGILGACKFGIADVAIVNLSNSPATDYKKLLGLLKSKTVLLFGVEPSAFGLPINFPHFQLQAFANNTFLSSPCLDELETDKLMKSKLWVCLKRLYNI